MNPDASFSISLALGVFVGNLLFHRFALKATWSDAFAVAGLACFFVTLLCIGLIVFGK